MTPIVLGIAGAIGSGKSTLSHRLAESLHWDCASFGNYVRSIAKRRDLGEGRKQLQDLGKELIAAAGWDGFCRDVLESAAWSPGKSLVLDGVRHKEVVDALNRIVSPGIVLLVYISPPDIDSRPCRTGAATIEQLERIEADSTEIQVQTVLAERADLVVPGDASIECMTKRVLKWFRFSQGPSA